MPIFGFCQGNRSWSDGRNLLPPPPFSVRGHRSSARRGSPACCPTRVHRFTTATLRSAMAARNTAPTNAARDMNERRAGRLCKGIGAALQSAMVGSAFTHPKAALAPNYTRQLFDEVLFGWPLRLVFVDERTEQDAVLLAVFPGNTVY